jgi:hypothetical protein
MPAASERRAAPEAFPVRHVTDIPPQSAAAHWLVDSLWAASGVGIVGGQPKCLKTWLATELALAVASGGQALGRFAARQPGPVVFFAAEDSAPAMRARFEAVAGARGVRLADVPVLLLDVVELRLDDPRQLARLHATITAVQPRLLVLDPFIRLARLDENSAQEVSAVLGALRALQREHDLAVLVVHHMRKSPAAHPGQTLRGSGDFAAWADSGLYLLRRGDDLVLSVEHRSAPAPPPLRLRLAGDDAPHLVVEDLDDAPPATTAPTPAAGLAAEIVAHLRGAHRPQTTGALRTALRVRNAHLVDALRELQQRGLVARDPAGWTLALAPPTPAT